jgi:hypothetical protein
MDSTELLMSLRADSQLRCAPSSAWLAAASAASTASSAAWSCDWRVCVDERSSTNAALTSLPSSSARALRFCRVGELRGDRRLSISTR